MTNKQAQITINAIKFMLDNAQYSDDVEEALNMAINALTAQPEETHDKRTEMHACDCISRQSVLSDIESYMERIEKRTVYEEGYGKIGFVKAGTVVEHSVEIRNPKEIEYRDLDGRLKALDAIWTKVKTMPSARPERKMGKWDTALRDDPLIKTCDCICSICGGRTFGTPDFCPNCGADMRGDDNEID